MNSRSLREDVRSPFSFAPENLNLPNDRNGYLIRPDVQSRVIFELKKDGHPVNMGDVTDALLRQGLQVASIVTYLLSHAVDFEFSRFESENFTYNLKMIDALMPQILGALVIEACRIEESHPTVASLIDRVSQDAVAQRYDVLRQVGLTQRERKAALTYKLKNLLMALVLGMTADKAWDGIERKPVGIDIRSLNRHEMEVRLLEHARLTFGKTVFFRSNSELAMLDLSINDLPK